MTDDEIRSLVRVAIQKHLGTPVAAPPAPADVASGFLTTVASAEVVSRTVPVSISFGRYALPRADDDIMCIIEPAVACNHCGYCQCHGH